MDTSPLFDARAAIWREFSAGLIPLAEAQRRSAALTEPPAAPRQLVLRLPRIAPAPRPRHTRPAPRQSRQYANPMATTAARDDRLTPNAKALLQVLRARAGKGRTTTTTKTTLASIMSRSARTIRRYLLDLVRWGYVEVRTRVGRAGLDTGLVITLTDRVLPFFTEPTGLAAWLGHRADLPFAIQTPGLSGMTLLTPTNHSHKSPLPSVQKIALRIGSALRRPPG